MCSKLIYMVLEKLTIGNVYYVKHIGNVKYLGKWKMDYYVEGEKGIKGMNTFKLLSFRGNQLLSLTKKEIVNDLLDIVRNE